MFKSVNLRLKGQLIRNKVGAFNKRFLLRFCLQSNLKSKLKIYVGQK